MMQMNPMQLFQMMKGGNPQQVMTNMLKQNAGNNPILNNALNMLEKGDTQGIETLARNMCKERNINPDEMMEQIKTQFKF